MLNKHKHLMWSINGFFKMYSFLFVNFPFKKRLFFFDIYSVPLGVSYFHKHLFAKQIQAYTLMYKNGHFVYKSCQYVRCMQDSDYKVSYCKKGHMLYFIFWNSAFPHVVHSPISYYHCSVVYVWICIPDLICCVMKLSSTLNHTFFFCNTNHTNRENDHNILK